MSTVTRFHGEPSMKSREDEIRRMLEDLSPKEVKVEEELARIVSAMVGATAQMVNAAARIGRAFGQAAQDIKTNGGQQ